MTNPQQIDVLDHGYVRLVDSMGSDLSIVRSARVSYAAEPRGDGSDTKLLKYLLTNKHTSPFESVTFTFEIAMPIFIARQWLRHRTWSYNEISARYSELPETFYLPDLAQITTQHTSNKQMRTTEQNPNAERIRSIMARHSHYSYQLYKDLIANECPRELARAVLPLNIYTKLFATVDLHNLMHFIRLRLHSHAQYEIQVYASALLQLMADVVPTTTELFREQLEKEGILA